MSKTDLKNAQKVVERQMKEVSRVRDNLDESIGELQELLDNCNEAIDALEDAREALSRLV